jgi:hypothetical protein
MTSDVKAPTPDEAIVPPEAPARPPRWRALGRAGALVIVLGAGWLAGMKSHEIIDLKQISSATRTGVDAVKGYFERSGSKMLSGVQSVANWTTTPQQGASARGINAVAASDAHPELIIQKMDQVRASSEAAAEKLRGAIEHVASSMASNQRQLFTKLVELSERLDRVDRTAPTAATSITTKLDQMTDRMDRLERSTAVLPAQARSVASSTSAKSNTAQTLARAPAVRPFEKPHAPAGTKKIADWVVREVVNGRAILQGPRGLIDVATGDLVPGAGRVQSIARQGGRWTVATNKGVISAR